MSSRDNAAGDAVRAEDKRIAELIARGAVLTPVQKKFWQTPPRPNLGGGSEKPARLFNKKLHKRLTAIRKNLEKQNLSKMEKFFEPGSDHGTFSGGEDGGGGGGAAAADDPGTAGTVGLWILIGAGIWLLVKHR